MKLKKILMLMSCVVCLVGCSNSASIGPANVQWDGDVNELESNKLDVIEVGRNYVEVWEDDLDITVYYNADEITDYQNYQRMTDVPNCEYYADGNGTVYVKAGKYIATAITYYSKPSKEEVTTIKNVMSKVIFYPNVTSIKADDILTIKVSSDDEYIFTENALVINDDMCIFKDDGSDQLDVEETVTINDVEYDLNHTTMYDWYICGDWVVQTSTGYDFSDQITGAAR